MKLIPAYIRYRAKAIVTCLFVTGIFSSSYLLFDMPEIAVLYPLLLTFALGLILMAVDYVLFVKRHEKLTDGSDDLPLPENRLEEDYQLIIKELEEESRINRMKSSESYNDMVGYYTVWAHQIKTPIASMRLNLQSEDTPVSRKLTGDLARIEQYVEMVLTFLRLGSDNTDYLIKEYDIDEIIRPCVRKFSSDFINKKLRLEYEPVNHSAVTDSKWLSFIIEQVISNAVKYTSEGSVKICMPEKGLLLIEDTGIGISPEDLPRIFENGYTGFNGREDKRASGIGLYLCKRIADNLGHRIYAESCEGKGTKMYLDLRGRKIGIE